MGPYETANEDFVFMWNEAFLWDCVVALRRHYMGIEKDVDDLFYRWASFRRYLNIGAITERSLETDTFVLLYKFYLRHYRIKGSFMDKISLSLYPWYYSYSPTLTLREDAQAKDKEMRD